MENGFHCAYPGMVGHSFKENKIDSAAMLPSKGQRYFWSIFAGYLVHFLHKNIRDHKAKLDMGGPNPLKRVVKHCLQHASAGLEPHMRSHSTPNFLVLMYHQILPLHNNRSQIEEPGMIVTPESFSNHLKLIKKYFDSIRLYDWIFRREDGCALPSKACAATFDDSRPDNYEFAFPVMKEPSIPATIFLVSDMIGTNQMFCPERLANVVTSVAMYRPEHRAYPALGWMQHG